MRKEINEERRDDKEESREGTGRERERECKAGRGEKNRGER